MNNVGNTVRVIGLLMYMFFTINFAYANSVNVTPSYHYSGEIQFLPEQGFLKLHWQIAVNNRKQESISFLLRSTLNKVKVSGDHVSSFSLGDSQLGDQFQKIDITLTPAKTSTPRIINLGYQGILLPEPMSNEINQISTSAIELNVDSFWLPMDSRFNQLLTTDLHITVGKAWQLVGAGNISTTQTGYRLVNNKPAIDISFALSKDYLISKMPGYTLFDLRENQSGMTKLKSSIDFCINQLNARYGENDPLTNIDFTINDRPSSGYARGNYIALTDITDTPPDRLTQFVCHEIAHHWSGNGKFDTEENWLNEAFAEYVGMMMLREKFGQDAFKQRIVQFQKQIAGKKLAPIWTAEINARPEYLVSYRKAPLSLWALEQKIGKAAFEKLIELYMTSKTTSTEQLLKQLLQVTNKKTQDWFLQQLAQ